MSVKIEKIELAETQISTMTSEESNMRTLYMRDGVIDDTEQAALDRIKGKVGKLKEVVAKLRAEIEENKRIWESRSGDYDNVRSQLADLKTFGHGDAGTLDGEISTIPDLVTDQRWADATTALDQAEVSMGPVWEDYQLQKAAQADYDPLRADFDARHAAALVAEPQTEAIATPLTQIDTNIGAIDAYVEARDYVNTLDSLHIAISLLETAEQEILRVQEAKAIYETALAGLMPLLMQTTVSEFQKLADLQLELVTAQSAMEEAATLHDYETAKNRLDDLAGKVGTFLPEQERLRTLKAEYDGGLAAMRTRIVTASTSELATTAETQQKIIDVQAEMEQAATTEEFEQAIALQGGLDDALKAYEVIMEDRDLYETRLAALQDEIAEASVSQAKWEYLGTIQSDMATMQGEMESAAAGEKYEAALSFITELEGMLVEFYARIEAKKAEYETARAALDLDLERVAACTYKPLVAAMASVSASTAPIDTAVADEDWVKAHKLIDASRNTISTFDEQLGKYEDGLKKKINAKLPDIKKKLKLYSAAKSPIKGNVQKLVARIDAALGGSGDLEQAVKDADEAETQLKDLAIIFEIRTQIDDKWDINKDNESRDIVKKYKDNGTLKTLPMEARNLLVENMMDGVVSDEDHAAIQDIWSQELFVDRRFDDVDKKTRESIVKELANDPEVKQMEKDWPTMTEAQKKAMFEKLAKVPAGEDGWDVGMPDVKVMDPPVPAKDGSILLGFYRKSDDSMQMNTHPDAERQGFDKMVDTITHEIGHKYQAKLIKDLEDDNLVPGDPEYDQAKALKLCEDYRNNHNAEFNKIYKSSPEEAHSRTMGDEIRAGLNAASGGP